MADSVKVKKRKRSLQAVSVPAEIGIHIVVGLFAVLCILPFIFVIIISFSAEDSIRFQGYSFFPLEWSLNAYKYVLDLGKQLWVSYFNSFFVTIVGTILSLIMYILYSYALFRRDFKYRGFFTFFAFFTTLFGGGLAPTYCLCKQTLHLADTYWAMIIPALVAPFYIIIMRTFFQSSIPEELIEAAAIDGSGEYNTLVKIIIPITKPGIATVGLLTALGYWNDWFLAMLYLRDAKYFPLQYLLMRQQQQSDFLAKNAAKIGGTEVTNIIANLPTSSLRMALVVFIVVPIACAYPFFQRYIVAGLTIGSVKG